MNIHVEPYNPKNCDLFKKKNITKNGWVTDLFHKDFCTRNANIYKKSSLHGVN